MIPKITYCSGVHWSPICTGNTTAVFFSDLLPFSNKIELVSIFRKVFWAINFMRRKTADKKTFGGDWNTNISRLIISYVKLREIPA